MEREKRQTCPRPLALHANIFSKLSLTAAKKTRLVIWKTRTTVFFSKHKTVARIRNLTTMYRSKTLTVIFAIVALAASVVTEGSAHVVGRLRVGVRVGHDEPRAIDTKAEWRAEGAARPGEAWPAHTTTQD